jgi:hypothetical protein
VAAVGQPQHVDVDGTPMPAASSALDEALGKLLG